MKNNSDQIQLAKDLCARLAEHAETQGVSMSKMCRDKGLSLRTFSALAKGDADKYNLPGRIAALQAAVASIEAVPVTTEPPLNRDLQIVALCEEAIVRAMTHAGLDRVVLILGDTGTGKTTSVRLATEPYGARVVRIEATRVWNDRPRELLAAICEALGAFGGRRKKDSELAATPAAVRPSAALAEAVRRLNEQRRCLVIDEAHHLGPRCLDTVKTLVNATPGEFVLVALSTLWHRMNAEGVYKEAQQVVGNRLSEVVSLTLVEADAAALLSGCVTDPKEVRQATAAAASLGGFAYIRHLAAHLRENPGISPLAAIAEVAERRRCLLPK
jgi:type II secretory pathway predicted ATPase ExeA